MSQHDMTVDNAGAATVRVDINAGLQALASTSSGATAPTTTFANQFWYDTSTNILKKRNKENDAWITFATFDETGDLVTSMSMADITITGDITNSLIRKQPYYVENLSLFISGGTITVASGDGTALSVTNPAYICMPSNSTPGELMLYTIIANQVMTNTEMDGNLLGTTASTSWTSSRPMYLYAMSNDNEDAIAFAWGAIPHIKIAPASTEIGDPSSAVADEQISLYSFDDITEAEYDANNCFAIGSCTATKDASDVWTFDALTSRDGLGHMQVGRRFTYPTGHHGADTGYYTIPNGGTSAVYSSNVSYYRHDPNGIIKYDFSIRNDGGTDGAGAVDAKFAVPYYSSHDVNGIAGHVCGAQVRYAGGNYFETTCHIRSDNQNSMFFYDTGNQVFNWADVTNGNRNVHASLVYMMKMET